MISSFLRDKRVTEGVKLSEFLGAAQDAEKESIAVKTRAAA